jgi:hypothetical protein
MASAVTGWAADVVGCLHVDTIAAVDQVVLVDAGKGAGASRIVVVGADDDRGGLGRVLGGM